MFIEDIYNFIIFLRNQGQSRTYAPEEIQAAVNRAIIDKYNYEVGRFESTGRVTDSLQPFKRAVEINKSGTTFTLPDEYGHYTGISTIVSAVEYPVAYVLPDDEWGEWLRGDGLLAPEEKYGVVRVTNGAIEALPVSVNKIKLYYLKLSTDCKINYTVVNDRPVFSETGSVDPEFPKYDHNALLVQSIKYLGIELRDEILIAMDQFQPLKSE